MASVDIGLWLAGFLPKQPSFFAHKHVNWFICLPLCLLICCCLKSAVLSSPDLAFCQQTGRQHCFCWSWWSCQGMRWLWPPQPSGAWGGYQKPPLATPGSGAAWSRHITWAFSCCVCGRTPDTCRWGGDEPESWAGPWLNSWSAFKHNGAGASLIGDGINSETSDVLNLPVRNQETQIQSKVILKGLGFFHSRESRQVKYKGMESQWFLWDRNTSTQRCFFPFSVDITPLSLLPYLFPFILLILGHCIEVQGTLLLHTRKEKEKLRKPVPRLQLNTAGYSSVGIEGNMIEQFPAGRLPSSGTTSMLH